MGSYFSNYFSNSTTPQDPSPGSSRKTSAPRESANRSQEDPGKSPTTRTIKIRDDSSPQDNKTRRQKMTSGIKRLRTHKNNMFSKQSFLEALLKFRLLMWKNFLQQWRHPKQTVLEILIPVLITSLVLAFRYLIPTRRVDEKVFPYVNAYSLEYSHGVLAGMKKILDIAYSPKSPVLEEVLQSAMGTLLQSNRRYFPAAVIAAYRQGSDQIHAFNNSKQLQGLYAQEITTREILAAVEFDDRLHGATELPKTYLSYSIRFPEKPRTYSFYDQGARSWRTDHTFPMLANPGPRSGDSDVGGNDPGYVTELFVPLQQAISMELISKMTGQNMRSLYTINIKRFPHPAYWGDYLADFLKFLLPVLVVLSFIYMGVNFVQAIVVEKELQLKETMKIMGLPVWLHWTAWFCKQFIFQLIIAIILTILLKVRWFKHREGDNYAVFTNTPWSVLFFFLLLYLTCLIFFCFMISGFFSKGSSASMFTGGAWVISFLPIFLMKPGDPVSPNVQVFSCLLVNSAMAFGFRLIATHESNGGMQWGQFMSSGETQESDFTFGIVVLMLFIDCVLYMLITLYLEQVWPGPFGIPKPWYFIFQSEIWGTCRKSATNEPNGADNVTERRSKLPIPPKLAKFLAPILSKLTKSSKDTTQYEIIDYKVIKERDPEDRTIGVKLRNLTKVYRDQIVVNNLNLNIYNDQITVLLGHNGAGKTTTISMITGNIEATFGTVKVVGYDMRIEPELARTNIGLCTQHDVLFNELTVREHLEFFARLKGLRGPDLKTDIDTLIKKLELEPKRDYLSKGLSGGQKRRLCVGIALCGHARVVLLDEPTSGMDPASRRALWDLLQKEKQGRSMILTTHFMDEADVLGDRVAIMAGGKLQCVGTPFFLKRQYGVGYSLVIVKDVGFDTQRCTALVDKYIPGTVVKEDRGSEVTYNLPTDYSNTFASMLNDLESNAGSIKLKSYGLTATTLEDVFMSVGADLAPVTENKNTDSPDRSPTPTSTASANPNVALTNEIDRALALLDKPESSAQGKDLNKQRVRAVWLKLMLVWSRSWGHLMLSILVPIILINMTLASIMHTKSQEPTNKKRLLDLSSGYHGTETLLHYGGDSSAAAAYKNMFISKGMKLTTTGSTPINDYYLKRTNDPMIMASLKHKLIIGSTFDGDTVTAHFSNFGYHDVAVSLAAVHSALLKAYNPDSKLTVYNHPLKATYKDQTDLDTLMLSIGLNLNFGIAVSMSMVTAMYITFYIKERISGAKLLQKSSGLRPIVMWGSAAIFDWASFILICLPIIISFACYNIPGLSAAADLGRIFLCLMLCGAASMPLTYLVSNLYETPNGGFSGYMVVNILAGIAGTLVVKIMDSPGLGTENKAAWIDFVLQILPVYNLLIVLRNLITIGIHEEKCFQKCSSYQALDSTFKCNIKELCKLDENCCLIDNPLMEWKPPGILRYLLVSMICCVLFWVLLMMTEYGILGRIFTSKIQPPAVDRSSQDDDVIAEAERAHKVYNSNRAKQALFAIDLSKYYKRFLAVNRISFCVNDGECFGLLGVNGAGKTTTFKMLMGDESISYGEAFVSGHSVEKTIYKVHENIGYCPQFDALFMELTGRETLRIFALMRGFRDSSVASVPDAFGRALGFHKHLDKKVHQYSGGTRRKLNTAIAFLGKTRMIFIDEPTTGVDPAAKRHVWRAVRSVQHAGRGIVLTSHSMEECEALCSRLTIMVNGSFQCIGTPQHLKIKFSQGFTLTIKFKLEVGEGTSRKEGDPAARVKDFVNSNFKDPRLMEEYQDMLTYYLPDRSIPWSQIFGIMERGKQELHIEDYSIAQTTLEQIFLQFTKYQQQKEDKKTEKISDSTQKPDTKREQPGPTQKTSKR